MADGLLVAIKKFFEDNTDGYGRKVPLDELKSLSEQDRADFKAMLLAVGIETA